ncbi:MAG TPA: hypothetical protein PKE03_05370 [Bacteroidales bacterium]|nr:hypothetical protein [Bacteroidales bacterium]
MKTMLSLAMMFMMSAGSLSAGEHNNRTTAESAAHSTYISSVSVMESMPERPAEEAEINDIPFNTIRIAEQVGYDLRGMLPTEEDIDDIPFNTTEVARRHSKLR